MNSAYSRDELIMIRKEQAAYIKRLEAENERLKPWAELGRFVAKALDSDDFCHGEYKKGDCITGCFVSEICQKRKELDGAE